MSFNIYFGVPGSGKTTHAASVVYHNLKEGIPTYSNVDILGAFRYSTTDDLGEYQIENCDLIIDEAGIAYNNRSFKSLPKKQIEWFKLYRHYGVRNIYVYSQSYEDMDITLRRLCDRLFVVRRSCLPFLFSTRRIAVKIGIDEQTHQITDHYFFQPFGIKFFFAPRYWSMFDSWSAPALPPRPWAVCGVDGEVSPDSSRVLRALSRAIRRDSRALFLRKLSSPVRALWARLTALRRAHDEHEQEQEDDFTQSLRAMVEHNSIDL